MANAQIAKKLSILYCEIAESNISDLESKLYGVSCNQQNNIPNDFKLKVEILEYYNKMEDNLSAYNVKYNKCLKNILNG